MFTTSSKAFNLPKDFVIWSCVSLLPSPKSKAYLSVTAVGCGDQGQHLCTISQQISDLVANSTCTDPLSPNAPAWEHIKKTVKAEHKEITN